MVTLAGSPPKAAMFFFTQPQRGDLVEQAVVSRDVPPRFGAQRWMHQEAERAHAIVDGHDHDAALGHFRAVVQAVAARTAAERAAVNPEEHRRLVRLGGRPDVERQAVLAGRRQLPEIDAVRLALGLNADRAELRGVARSLPFRSGQRRLPAQRADRRLRVRNALEHVHVADGLALQLAGGCVDNWRQSPPPPARPGTRDNMAHTRIRLMRAPTPCFPLQGARQPQETQHCEHVERHQRVESQLQRMCRVTGRGTSRWRRRGRLGPGRVRPGS